MSTETLTGYLFRANSPFVDDVTERVLLQMMGHAGHKIITPPTAQGGWSSETDYTVAIGPPWSPDDHSFKHAFSVDSESRVVRARHGGVEVTYEAPEADRYADALGSMFWRFLTDVDPDLADKQAEALNAELGAAVEVVVTLWREAVAATALPADDRRLGDAMAAFAMTAVETDSPPKSVLREVFKWFAAKADRFADEFASTAGKSVAVGTGVVISGHWQQLIGAIEHVRAVLG